MEVQIGLNAIDELNLLYKIQRKIKVFNTSDPLPNRGYNLIANSSKYAAVFIASPIGLLSVYSLKNLIDKECEPHYLPIKLPEKPTHVAVSCDDELLAVTGGQLLLIYKIDNFQNQNITPVVSIKFEVNPTTYVTSLQWNPCIPDTIALAFYDGSLLVAQVNNGQLKKIQCNARCLCWSPKGKQLVVANSDGTLCQYKPDLSLMKSIPAPNLYEGAPIEALAVYWISTYQFVVVYKNAQDNRGPAITIVNTSKSGQPSCLNYEDICYSTGSNRPWFSYLQGLPQWNIIIASSSNSMEMATLSSEDGVNWQQWCQPDEARPELPLTDKKQENYPVGISVDTCGIHQIPWGENEVLPPMPLLHVLSQTGLLTIFNIINLDGKAARFCTPPQCLVLPASAMTNVIPDDVQPQPHAAPQPQPVFQEQTQPNLEPPSSAQQSQQNYEYSMMNKYQSSMNATAQIAQPISTAPAVQAMQSMRPPEICSIPPTQALMQSHPVPQAKIPTTEVTKELSEAEIEAMNRNKMIKLKKLLVKEVNDFQTELYNFMVEARELHIQHEHELKSINMSFDLQSLDTEQLKKSCSLEELHGAIVQLKLELVRACAAVAEARAHAETKDIYQWTQVDPLTAKRAASIKNLAYYVQTQLEQAQRALEHKWNEAFSNDNKSAKVGQGMIRPVLDEVYQPLVRQQEILGRQRAVLRALRSAALACDPPPLSAPAPSLLRNTPFKNKDPLSKLTKNILNMSIEPQNETKQPLLSAHKLEALRDALSNHKTVKIKSVNTEFRQRIAAMRLTHEKKIELEKDIQDEVQVKTEHPTIPLVTQIEKPEIKPVAAFSLNVTKTEKIEPPYEENITVPQPILNTFTPVNVSVKPTLQNANVARTLFTDEPKTQEVVIPKPQQPVVQIPMAPKPTKFGFAPPTTVSASANTKSILKDMLNNKSQLNIEAKLTGNTFMGQTICSPAAFSLPQQTNTIGTSASVFAAKSEPTNVFSKPQSSITQIGGKAAGFKSISSDSDEIENPKQITSFNKDEKPALTLGSSTSLVPGVTLQSVPDIIKIQETSKLETKTVEKIADKLKENIPKNDSNIESLKNTAVTSTDNKNDKENKQIPSKFPYLNEIKKPEPIKTDFPKATELNKPSSAASIFAAANSASASKSESLFVTKTTATAPSFGAVTSTSSSTTTKTETSITSSDTITPTVPKSPETSSSASETTSSDSASFIFAKAVASQPSIFKTSPTKTTIGSIFGNTTSPTSSQGSIFAPSKDTTTGNSVFGVATTSSPPSPSSSTVFETSTSESTPATVFGTTADTSSVFSASKPTQSIFGTAATTQASTFGIPAKTQSAFESPTQTSVFGTTATSQPQGFGSPSGTRAVFGNAANSQPSIFGSSSGNTPTATSPPPAFGSQIPTTQASVFGSAPQSNQGLIFGSQPAAQGSAFGAQTPQPSMFSTTTTTQSGSIFGGTDNLFAAASISSTGASSPTSGGNGFGGGSSSSAFGGNSNSNVFGGKTAFSQSNSSAAAIFGGAGGANSFAQKPATNFWDSNAGNTTGFGSGFGQPTTQASIFGGGSGGSFSSGTPGQAFGSPQQSAFGSQQSGSTFGGSPVFGSKPAFAQPTGFGAPASGFGSFSSFNKSPSGGFGAPAAFGGSAFGSSSPGKVFGGSSPGFAAPTQSNAMFESLATENTVTFGNLAQQSVQQTQPATNFNTSPSFTGWRG